MSGNTRAAAWGKEMHKKRNYGPGFVKEFRLPSGRRVDAINFATGEVIELKPNNSRAIRRGHKQIEGYLAELNRHYPRPGGSKWTGKVVTYDHPSVDQTGDQAEVHGK